MPTVTLLKPQKNGKRVNVFLDGKFSFGIDLDNLVMSHIVVGGELSDDQVKKIVRKAEFQKTLDKLLRFATLRPRSEKEINDYLKRKKVHQSLWTDLVKKLKHFDLLDDIKFAKWWLEQRLSFRPKSKRILKQELRLKGIKREIIEEVLEKVRIDEEKIAKDLLKKKTYKWEKLEPKIKRQKMTHYLAGKGFSWQTIEKILRKR